MVRVGNQIPIIDSVPARGAVSWGAVVSARAESALILRKVALGATAEGLPAAAELANSPLRGVTRRGVAQLFDLGIRGLRDEFGWLVLISTLVWFPLRLLPLQISLHGGGQQAEVFGAILLTVSNGIAQTITTALLARRLAASYRDRGALIPKPRRYLLACLPGILGLGLVTGVATGVGTCLCLLPGIYLAFKLSLAPTVLVLEDASISDSIRRSLHLTTTSFWRWAGLMLSVTVLAGPVSSGVGLLEQPLLRQQVQEWSGLSALGFAWLYAAVSSLFLAFATALTSAVIIAYYFDLLERRDGVDLEQQLRALRKGEASA